MKERVIEIQYISTAQNPSHFCEQDHLIPFGAECYQEPEPREFGYGSTVMTDFVSTQEELAELFRNLNYFEEERQFSQDYFRGDAIFSQLAQRLPSLEENGWGLCINFHEVTTHTAGLENLCGVQLHADFMAAVAALPPSYETEEEQLAYDYFIEKFGSGVLTEIELGGRVILIIETPNYGCYPLNLNNLLNH